jgi:hypothetical protein
LQAPATGSDRTARPAQVCPLLLPLEVPTVHKHEQDADERREAWMRSHIDSQPPLTANQREHLRAVLGGTARVQALRSHGLERAA